MSFRAGSSPSTRLVLGSNNPTSVKTSLRMDCALFRYLDVDNKRGASRASSAAIKAARIWYV
jgi:hypothetical protein